MENQIFLGSETNKNLWSDYELFLIEISSSVFGLVDDFGVNVMPSLNAGYCSRMVNAHR